MHDRRRPLRVAEQLGDATGRLEARSDVGLARAIEQFAMDLVGGLLPLLIEVGVVVVGEV